MSGVFINYRREDSAPYAGRLYDHLRQRFPGAKVFMDIDAIAPGEDFVDAIDRTLAASKVVLAVIGPKWESAIDATGQRRLMRPDDFVAQELRAALAGDVRVIPVLVAGASMPQAAALPPDLQALTRRNAIEVSDSRFAADVDRLCAAIAPALGQEPRSGKDAADTQAADAFTLFKAMLWTLVALSIVSVLFASTRPREGYLYGIALALLVFLPLTIWLYVKILQGRNWARMVYVAITLLTAPYPLFEWREQMALELATNVFSSALSLWLVRVMFTDPIRRMFAVRPSD